MASLIKQEPADTVYTMELTQVEVNLIAVLVGKQSNNDVSYLAKQYKSKMPNDGEMLNLYNAFDRLRVKI